MRAIESSPTVALVRHAATDWSGHRYCGRTDRPLSQGGQRAAQELALRLVELVGPDARIVSSPLQRALATARAIATATGVAIEIDDRWREADFGLAEGLTFDELAAIEPALAHRLAAGDVEIDWPDGEAAVSLAARVDAAWAEVVDVAGSVVVVAHAGPLRIALARAFGRPVAELAVPAPGEVTWIDRAVPAVRSIGPTPTTPTPTRATLRR